MSERKCPACERGILHISNVMGSVKEIHWRCNKCDYVDKTGYNKQKHGQSTLFEIVRCGGAP